MSLEGVFSQHLRPEFRPRAQRWEQSSDKTLSRPPAPRVTCSHRTRGKALGLLVVKRSGREGLQCRPPEDDPSGHPGPRAPSRGSGPCGGCVWEVKGGPVAGASGQGDGVGLGVGWGLPRAPVSLWALSPALGRPR